MLHRGRHLAERHSRRDMVHGQLVSHRALDGDNILVLVNVRDVLDEQLQRQSLLLGLGSNLLSDRDGHATIVIVKVDEHLIRPEEQVSDDDVDDGRQHMERERIGLQINILV